MLLLFVVGDVLGGGIYVLTGRVAAQVGGAVWLPFLLALVLAGLTAASYAELVGKYPQAGGAAVYTDRAFDRPVLTFLVAFAVIASGVTSASAAARAFAGRYLAQLLTAPTVLVGIGFVCLLALVNFLGVQASVWVSAVCTVVEVIGLLVVLFAGATVLGRGAGEPARAVDLEGGGTSLALSVLAGSALAFYALLGFEDSVNMAEETHRPARAFPRALFAGLATAGLLYLGVAFVSTTVVAPQVLASSDGPLLEVVHAAGLSFPPRLFAAIALFAITNTALLDLLMASLLVYGLARQGLVPAGLGVVHATRRTPWVAILVTTALAAVLIATGDLTALADTTVLLLLLVFAAVNVAVLVLRRDPVDVEHFTTPTVAPVLGAVTCLLLASPFPGRDPGVYGRALALLGLGAIFWAVNRAALHRARPSHPRRPPPHEPPKTRRARRLNLLTPFHLPGRLTPTRAAAPPSVPPVHAARGRVTAEGSSPTRRDSLPNLSSALLDVPRVRGQRQSLQHRA